MKEIWKDIKGYEGLYIVSNLGNIKSLDRLIICRNNHLRKIYGRVLKQFKINSGYYTIKLWTSNKFKQILVHRLVAETFIPNPNCLPEVNHKDGNKENNCINNLEWVTKSENVQHAVNNNLTKNQKFVVSANNKKLKSKPVIQYDIDGNYIATYNSVSEICRLYNYSQGAISNVCRNERSKAYGYIWKYKQEEK